MTAPTATGMRKVGQLLGWIAATALVVFCLREVQRTEVRPALSLIRPLWIIAALIANAGILLSWAALWWIVTPRAERPVYWRMFEINAMASALMNTVPFLGGHAAAVVLLIKRGGMTRHAALSVMALDQLGEGCAKVTIFLLVAILAPIPVWMRSGIIVACTGVAALFVILLLAAHGHEWIRDMGAATRDAPQY